MFFRAKILRSQVKADKPVILCDVRGTLLNGNIPNTSLIRVLNSAEKAGFDIRLCTYGYGGDGWDEDKHILKHQTNLSSSIIENARSKGGIIPTTFSNAIAIIDDNKDELYISFVQQRNANAKYFAPSETDLLLRHLQVMKPRHTQRG